MALKLYLDEDVDPFLAQTLRDRGIDCVSTRAMGKRGLSDADQLAYAIHEGRMILTFNVKDFVRLAQEYATTGRRHSGIIVSNHIPFRELLRRTLFFIKERSDEDTSDKLFWLQDYKNPQFN